MLRLVLHPPLPARTFSCKCLILTFLVLVLDTWFVLLNYYFDVNVTGIIMIQMTGMPNYLGPVALNVLPKPLGPQFEVTGRTLT